MRTNFLCSLCFLLFITAARAATMTIIAPDKGEDPHGWPARLAAAIARRDDAAGVTGNRVVILSDSSTLIDVTPGRPVHLIGHAGGVDLAPYFQKVDHFTALDPVAITVPSNVLFADNYYQTNGLTRGVRLPGALNQQVLVPTATAFLVLAAWYTGTITNGLDNGYYFTDCPHGKRPGAGYLARQVGQPRLAVGYDAAVKTFTMSFSGGATGSYYLDYSSDLQNWTFYAGKVYDFDGRPYSVTQTRWDLATEGNRFYRLRQKATVAQ
jgi:hypothetical protein